MAKAYITEYQGLTLTSRGGAAQMPHEPPVATQVIDTAGTHLSAAFNAATQFIRVNVDNTVSMKIGSAPTAATTDPRMSQNETAFFGVNAGEKIDIIANT